MNIKDLPRAHAGYVDTPLEFMPGLTKQIGKGKLYIKRDDMTGLAFGGNKSRKLDYLVQYALDNGYSGLMTFGGVQTNHGRMTMAAAVKFGLKPVLVLTGAKPDYCSGNLILDKILGADIVFLDTSAFKDLPPAEKAEKTAAFMAKSAEELIAKYAAQGIKLLNVPVGGQGIIGAAGYIQAVPEIMRQMKEQNITAKYLVCGYGSTGTFGGLVAGAKYYKAPFEVIGIPVNPVVSRGPEATAKFVNEVADYYDMGFTVTPEDIRIETGTAEDPYGGIGYNIPDKITQSYIELLARSEGIFTDPCYTGKIFHGFVDLVRRGVIPNGENAIFLHSGGTPALWSKEHLDDMQKTYWSTDEGITILKA